MGIHSYKTFDDFLSELLEYNINCVIFIFNGFSSIKEKYGLDYGDIKKILYSKGIELYWDKNFAPEWSKVEHYKKINDFKGFEIYFGELLENRDAYTEFKEKYSPFFNIAIVCYESSSKKCHRKIVIKYLLRKSKSLNICCFKNCKKEHPDNSVDKYSFCKKHFDFLNKKIKCIEQSYMMIKDVKIHIWIFKNKDYLNHIKEKIDREFLLPIYELPKDRKKEIKRIKSLKAYF